MRVALQAVRASLPAERAAAAAESVARRVLALPAVAAAERVGLYAALPDELPTGPLLEALRQLRKPTLFPRCGRDGRLEFAPAAHFEDLRAGRYGVAEPVAAAVALSDRDCVVVPGVAFDRHGGRLGRGRAWYDRTFPAASPTPTLVGVGYAFQCVDAVPVTAEDRRLDAVVTDEETWWRGREVRP